MSIIDPQALEPYREMMGEAFIVDIIETYLNNSPVLLASLATSFENGNATEFTRAAHTLKSNSAMLGAKVLSEQCFLLEQAGKTGNIAGLSPEIEKLNTEYKLVCANLKELLQKP
jgi:HPt (histidine-containing phosphotransfer) domain-containing protein